MLLEVASTGITVTVLVQTGATLRADTHAVTDLDAANGLGADTLSDTDDLVSNTAGVVGGALINPIVSLATLAKGLVIHIPIRCAECASQIRTRHNE
jgi:hypothetical protein